jgi:hypothetical protein
MNRSLSSYSGTLRGHCSTQFGLSRDGKFPCRRLDPRQSISKGESGTCGRYQLSLLRASTAAAKEILLGATQSRKRFTTRHNPLCGFRQFPTTSRARYTANGSDSPVYAAPLALEIWSTIMISGYHTLLLNFVPILTRMNQFPASVIDSSSQHLDTEALDAGNMLSSTGL